jgi:SAM-dependent methyltransferase
VSLAGGQPKHLDARTGSHSAGQSNDTSAWLPSPATSERRAGQYPDLRPRAIGRSNDGGSRTDANALGRFESALTLHPASAAGSCRQRRKPPEQAGGGKREPEASRGVSTEKYDPQADQWTESAYADPSGYLAHRAELVATLGPLLEPEDTVLDLACGDAGLAEPLLARGLRYLGVDLSPPMVDAARRRVGDRAEIVLADLNDYRPPAPVACTSCFRAVYYARNRPAFFRHVASYTEKKLVFDLNPRQYRTDGVVADLEAAGLGAVVLHPFLFPQRFDLRSLLRTALHAAERSGPLARMLLRLRFSYLVAASRGE